MKVNLTVDIDADHVKRIQRILKADGEPSRIADARAYIVSYLHMMANDISLVLEEAETDIDGERKSRE